MSSRRRDIGNPGEALVVLNGVAQDIPARQVTPAERPVRGQEAYVQMSQELPRRDVGEWRN